MKVNLLSLIAILASGTAATVAVKPIASIPFIVIGAIVVAIIIWTLSRGGRLALGRSRTGYLSFKLYGAKTRPQNSRRRPAAARAQNGPPSAGSVPPEGAPSLYPPRSATGYTGRIVSVIVVIVLVFGGVWAVAK